MRYFIISDLHANLEALESILEDMTKREGFNLVPASRVKQKLVLLGDMIGYMPNPNEVMDTLWPIADNILTGNHEILVGDILKGKPVDKNINPCAVEALYWNAKVLSEENQRRIRALYSDLGTYILREQNLVFTHSNPHVIADMSYYITEPSDAIHLFFGDTDSKGKTAFVGHSHQPQVYALKNRTIAGNGVIFDSRAPGSKVVAPAGLKGIMRASEEPSRRVAKFRSKGFDSSLFCIPSGGQPRDGFNWAGYAIYDSEKEEMQMVRVPYDIKKTQKRMIDLGFNPYLSGRIASGC